MSSKPTSSSSPIWLKALYFFGAVAVLALVGIALFKAFSPLLPIFGSIEIHTEGRRQIIKEYGLSCKTYDVGRLSSGTLSFYDESRQSERKLFFSLGKTLMSGRGLAIYELGAIDVDGTPLNREDCAYVKGTITQAKQNDADYLIQMDCNVDGQRLIVNVHGYSCLREKYWAQ